MERFVITIGDFLKNAGIVGMKYMLDLSRAQENIDYGITENKQGLWIEKEFALNADWTDLYFEAFLEYFGPSTVYQTVLEKIQVCLERIDSDEQKLDNNDLKFINEKLLSNSYQSGYENIKEKIQNPQVYLELKKSKLSDKIKQEELKERLEELLEFLKQTEVRKTFRMKSIIYTYINRFWEGKCFLLRANAKKDMGETFEKEFSIPLRKYWSSNHAKAKDRCIDCGELMNAKEKVSIAFMKEMADDLTRKKSAFWQYRVDAYLCPACAYVYALSPLGFQLYANKFVFFNVNENLSYLVEVNSKEKKNARESGRKEEEKYAQWFARILNIVLSQKVKELSNIQVILRGIRAEDAYMLSIISREALTILKQEKVTKSLENLAKYPYVKINRDFINVPEQVVMNILQYRSQYPLLNRLLKESIQNKGILAIAYWVFTIQIWSGIVRRKQKDGEDKKMGYLSMRNNGYELRKAILQSKGEEDDDCMRGIIYQLLNALSVKNQEKFMDIVIRMYTSTKLLMPDGFAYMLGNQDVFLENGYAFVLGLKGSHPENKVSNKKSDKKEEEKNNE